MKSNDLTGQKLNMLLVLERVESWDTKVRYRCVCDCGKETIAISSRIRTGKTKSCGCLISKASSERNRTHGMTKTATYKTWASMLSRCNNTKSNSYKEYGADGVIVCDRWSSFEDFLEDMGERPEGMTLNRINGAKVYCKETCEWTTLSAQSYDQKKSSDNTSGRTGVYYNKQNSNWTAAIGFGGKCIHLGSFSSFSLAVEARESAEIFYYGKVKK